MLLLQKQAISTVGAGHALQLSALQTSQGFGKNNKC
jgi:hypothetical protein